MDSFTIRQTRSVSDGDLNLIPLFTPSTSGGSIISGILYSRVADAGAEVTLTIHTSYGTYITDTLDLSATDNRVTFVFPVPVDVGNTILYSVNFTPGSGDAAVEFYVNVKN